MLTTIAIGVYAEDYRFTVDPKCDSIVVYDKNDSVVLTYSKQILLLHGNPIAQTKVGKTVVFSDTLGEIGTVLSNKYTKIQMPDGSLYKRKFFWKNKVSYKKDGETYATARFSFEKKLIDYFAFFPSRNRKTFVEMNIQDTKLIPILFFSTLKHIQMKRDEAEQMAWMSLYSLSHVTR
ncbi:MAG: hypothetical protein LBH04_11815 [Tannerellaceae bacterium]|nr:hypothetical protein [Tannerellaceae bacterium]